MSWLLAVLLSSFVGGPSPDSMIVEFTVDNCRPCEQLQPALEKLKTEGWTVRTVNATREPQMVRKFAVDSLPTLILVLDGKEVDRIVGAAPYDKILPRLAKLLLANTATTSPQQSRSNPAAKAEQWQSPTTQQNSVPNSEITVRGQSPSGAFPMLGAVASSTIASPVSPSSQAIAEKFNTLSKQLPASQTPALLEPVTQASFNRSDEPVRDLTELNAAQQPNRISSEPTKQLARTNKTAQIDLQEAIARAEAATVRIRVDEENTTAYGTGTVIDVHGDEALVLTCGHLFREMKPNSQLTIDFFAGRSQPMNIPAQLIDFKADAGDVDIGLISFKLPFAIEPVPLLPQSEMLVVRQPAFSFGCDHGENPTRRDTQVKSINRYMGAPNVEIAGAPAVGRSGGGLFDHQGRLVGVCNAADAEGDEGIYAAADIVYAQIERLGLTHLVVDNQLPQNAPTQLAVNPSGVSFASNQTPVTQSSTANQSVLASGASQITCIVRDAGGREQIVRVDSPSSELLNAIYRQASSGSNP